MRIAIVTNILTPYRMRFYNELGNQLVSENGGLKVFAMTDQLPLRPWTYDQLKSEYTELLTGHKWFWGGENYDQLYNPQINRALKQFSPDVVIVAGSWTYFTEWRMMTHKLKGVKYYFWSESHNVRADRQISSKKSVLYSAKRMFYKQFDGYCIPGKYATEALDELVGNYGKRVRLPNLVDDAYYSEACAMRLSQKQIRGKYNLAEDKTVFFTPARLIGIKGMDTYLEHISQCRYVKNAIFVLSGEGPLKQKIEAIGAKYNLDIRLLGFCNQETIRELLACADFFLLPSLTDANPLTVIEAAFSGLPLCVSQYVGNSPELVVNKKNGVVFDTMNQTSVIESFEYVMSCDINWRNKAREISIAMANEDFSCENETRKLIEYFKNAI